MPPRKRPSSVLNGDTDDLPREADRVTSADDALAAAEEADAEAAEAEAVAAAARARARAIRLRREAAAAAAPKAAEEAKAEEVESTAVEVAATNELDQPSVEPAEPVSLVKRPEVDAPEDDDAPAEQDAADEAEGSAAEADVDELEDDLDETPGPPSPAPWKLIAKALVASVALVGSIALLGLSGAMYWHHRNVEAQQAQSAEFAAAARQGVVTLMSLDFNKAKEDVQRIIDNTTGDFKKDFQGQADQFVKVAQESKVVTQANVNAVAVQSMAKDDATVLVAVTTDVSNVASNKQEPRSWRLKVGVTRDGDQIKLAKVEFVP